VRDQLIATGCGNDKKINVTTFCSIIHTGTEQIQFIACGKDLLKSYPDVLLDFT